MHIWSVLSFTPVGFPSYHVENENQTLAAVQQEKIVITVNIMLSKIYKYGKSQSYSTVDKKMEGNYQEFLLLVFGIFGFFFFSNHFYFKCFQLSKKRKHTEFLEKY